MVEGGWCDRVEKLFRLLDCGVEYNYGPSVRWVGDQWDTEDLTDWRKCVKSAIQYWEELQYKSIVEKMPKLKLYRRIEPYKEFRMKPYLNSMSYYNETRLLTSFRSGTNELMVETGRYFKLPREWRLCPMCFERCEDEQHVLLECEAYSCERSMMKRKLNAMRTGIIPKHFWNGSSNSDRLVEHLLGY